MDDIIEFPEDVEEAKLIQERLRLKNKDNDLEEEPGLVAGADVSYLKDKGLAIGAIVVIDAKSREIVEEVVLEREVNFPYIPGYLAFREVPALLKAYHNLSRNIDIIFVDGQGRAHPRGMGLANHFGILIDKPTIGVAKNRLTGRYEDPGLNKGDFTDLILNGKIIGRVVRTRTGVKPVFVSQGQYIGLDNAVRLTLEYCSKYKLPDPIRYADRLAGIRRKELKEQWN